MPEVVNGLWCPECGKIPEVGGCDEEHLCTTCGAPIIIRQVLVAVRDAVTAEAVSAEREALDRTLQAICLTRDYVGADILPAIEGWEWYEAGKMAAALIPDSEWAKQFKLRIAAEEK